MSQNDFATARSRFHCYGVTNFRDLRVWHEARALARSVRKICESLTGTNNAELRDQLIRSAMSVPTNIVEGSGHKSRREFARYLRYSIASASECEGHMQLALDFYLVSQADHDEIRMQIENVRKMLCGLVSKLEESRCDSQKAPRNKPRPPSAQPTPGTGKPGSDPGEHEPGSG